jgi:hypothetical protein
MVETRRVSQGGRAMQSGRLYQVSGADKINDVYFIFKEEKGNCSILTGVDSNKL